MADPLKRAVNYKFDLRLWPLAFIQGCAQVAARHRLNIDSVILGLLVGTSVFIGKSEIALEGGDRKEAGSLWFVNIQVNMIFKIHS